MIGSDLMIYAGRGCCNDRRGYTCKEKGKYKQDFEERISASWGAANIFGRQAVFMDRMAGMSLKYISKQHTHEYNRANVKITQAMYYFVRGIGD